MDITDTRTRWTGKETLHLQRSRERGGGKKKETSLQDTTKSHSQRVPAVWQIPHQIISWLPFLFKRSRWLWRAWRAANVYRINEGELRLRHRQVEPQENLICSRTPQRSHWIRHISLPTYPPSPLPRPLFHTQATMTEDRALMMLHLLPH